MKARIIFFLFMFLVLPRLSLAFDAHEKMGAALKTIIRQPGQIGSPILEACTQLAGENLLPSGMDAVNCRDQTIRFNGHMSPNAMAGDLDQWEQQNITEMGKTISLPYISQREAAERLVAPFKVQIVGLNAKISELEGRVSGLTSETESKRGNAQELQAQLRAEQAKTAKLQGELAALSGIAEKLAKSENEKIQLQSQIDSLSMKLEALQEHQKRFLKEFRSAFKQVGNDMVVEINNQNTREREFNESVEWKKLSGWMVFYVFGVLALCERIVWLFRKFSSKKVGEVSIKERKAARSTLGFLTRKRETTVEGDSRHERAPDFSL